MTEKTIHWIFFTIRQTDIMQEFYHFLTKIYTITRYPSCSGQYPTKTGENQGKKMKSASYYFQNKRKIYDNVSNLTECPSQSPIYFAYVQHYLRV